MLGCISEQAKIERTNYHRRQSALASTHLAVMASKRSPKFTTIDPKIVGA